MTNHLNLGKTGESLAVEYLLKEKYQILETNWRYRRAEVDIIALDIDTLVFVEVKTRYTDLWGAPEYAVSSKKEQLLTDAASQYMDLVKHKWEIRFDIISIIANDNETRIEHFKDAFFPDVL